MDADFELAAPSATFSPPTSSNAQVASVFKTLEVAALNPDGREMDEILRTIRTMGLRHLGSTTAREAATALLDAHGARLEQPIRFLLRRLQHAGLAPKYDEYMAVPLLTNHDEYQDSSDVVRSSVRVIYDLIEHLLELDELQAHPRRQTMEQRAAAVLELCRQHTFAATTDVAPFRLVTRMSLLPETGVPDELLFMRVTQCSEIVFASAKVLCRRAADRVAHSRAGEAFLDVHCIVCLGTLLIPLLRLLSPMSVQTWLGEIRHFILLPSAIESSNFRDFHAELGEIDRVFEHPRYPRWEVQNVPYISERLREARRLLRQWQTAHLQIARKYGEAHSGPTPPGVGWLERGHLTAS